MKLSKQYCLYGLMLCLIATNSIAANNQTKNRFCQRLELTMVNFPSQPDKNNPYYVSINFDSAGGGTATIGYGLEQLSRVNNVTYSLYTPSTASSEMVHKYGITKANPQTWASPFVYVGENCNEVQLLPDQTLVLTGRLTYPTTSGGQPAAQLRCYVDKNPEHCQDAF